MRRRLLLTALTLLLVAGCGGPAGSAAPSGQSARPTAPVATSTRPAPSRPGTSTVASPAATPALPSLSTASIALEGDGPIGLAVDGATAWVITADGGELLAVDLSGAAAQRSFVVGPWGTHVLVGGPDEILVARFDTGGTGQPLATVDPGTGVVGGVATGPLAGFDLTPDGRLWNLGTEGEIVVVDAARTQVVGRTSIDVNPNEHLDGVAGAGSFWASSDTTPVRRLDGEQPAVSATVETGGGIPLAFANGLVWGARADELWGIDPVTNQLGHRIPLDGLIEILDLDVAGERAWIAARKPGRIGVVVGIDLATGNPVGEARVSLPAGVVIAGDRVWVTNYDGDELIGIDQPPA